MSHILNWALKGWRRLHGVESDPKLSEKNFKNKAAISSSCHLPISLSAPRCHTRPGRAPLLCTIYPLSAASVGAGRYCARKSVMRQPQLSLILLAWKRYSLLLTIFVVVSFFFHFFPPSTLSRSPRCSIFFFFPFYIPPLSTLSRSPCFIWWKCIHSLPISYKEKSFLEQ